MTHQPKSGNFPAPRQAESDVLGLIKRMQQQLTFLERKIDTLINQSQEKPFRSFDRPYRPDQHHGKRGLGENPKARGYRPGRHSEKHQEDDTRGFGGKRRGFGPKKKLPFHKRKDQ